MPSEYVLSKADVRQAVAQSGSRCSTIFSTPSLTKAVKPVQKHEDRIFVVTSVAGSPGPAGRAWNMGQPR